MNINKPVAIGVAAALVLGLGVAYYFASPLLALSALRSAAESGDRSRMEELIDFPRVREGLKSDLRALMAEEIKKSSPAAEDNLLGVGLEQLALGMVGMMVDGAIDQLVSPASLEKAFDDQPVTVEALGEPTQPLDNLFPKGTGGDRYETSKRYRSLSRYQITLKSVSTADRVEIDMQRQGLFGWRVVRVTPRISMDNLAGNDNVTDAGASAGPAISEPLPEAATDAEGPAETPLQAAIDPLTAEPGQVTASFDCRRARTFVERSICASATLSGLDRDIAAAYRTQLGIPGEQSLVDEMVREQRAWLRERNACQTADCIKVTMEQRLENLPEP